MSTCKSCNGTGVIQHHRSRWIGGSTLGYRSEWTIEEPCGCGAPEPTPSAAPNQSTLERLAAKARMEGVRLLHDPATDAFYATSGTIAGTRYAVTPTSCECRGFAYYGRCKHVAALTAALGWIPGPVSTADLLEVA